MSETLLRARPGIRVAATASVELADPSEAPHRISGIYADPACWLVAEAVGRLLESPDAGPGVDAGPGTGVIGISEHATAHTLRRTAEEIADGRVMPMRFAAASPGALVGIVCACFGFQGPSSMLSMPPAKAEPAAAALAADWLAGPAPMADRVLVVTYEITADARHAAGCALLSRAASTNRRRDL